MTKQDILTRCDIIRNSPTPSALAAIADLFQDLACLDVDKTIPPSPENEPPAPTAPPVNQ